MDDIIATCTIKFESDLSEKTKKVLITAIRRFAGVRDLTIQYEANHPHQNRVTPSVASLASEEHRRIPTPNALPPDKVEPKVQKMEALEPGDDYLQQRQLIDFAIKWGITTKKVNWGTIQQLSPEQIVEKAFALIKEMPSTEIKKIEAWL